MFFRKQKQKMKTSSVVVFFACLIAVMFCTGCVHDFKVFAGISSKTAIGKPADEMAGHESSIGVSAASTPPSGD